MHQWFVIERGPCFDMLNFAVQDENLAEIRVFENGDDPKRAPSAGHGSKPSEGNANSPEKVSDFPLCLLHTFQRIIFSYPRLPA